MFRLTRIRFLHVVIYSLLIGFLWISPMGPQAAPVRADGPPVVFDGKDDKDGKDRRKKKKRKKKSKKKVIRWGQRPGESNATYDKRYSRVFKRTKRDKRNDFEGGRFRGADGQPFRMYTYMGHPGCPFVCRTDIDKEFTANLAMYMEAVHREYSHVWKIAAQQPSTFKEKVEVIVYADRMVYIANGGSAGSGGFFTAFANERPDRGASWPARRYRLVQFTDEIRDFAKWPKGTLKHECGHMELQVRLGFTSSAYNPGRAKFKAIWAPIWWNEGIATTFENWDIEKTVEHNFAEIPKRGRYAPFIRRIYDTDDWKDLEYYWELSSRGWHSEPSLRVYLNYAQASTIVGYMMSEGHKGRRHFRRMFDLIRRVGGNRQQWINQTEVGGLQAWRDAFPEEELDEIEKGWMKWVAENYPRDGTVPDEEFNLRRSGVDPSIKDRLTFFDTKAERDENTEWVEKEKVRRRKSKDEIER